MYTKQNACYVSMWNVRIEHMKCLRFIVKSKIYVQKCTPKVCICLHIMTVSRQTYLEIIQLYARGLRDVD